MNQTMKTDLPTYVCKNISRWYMVTVLEQVPLIWMVWPVQVHNYVASYTNFKFQKGNEIEYICIGVSHLMI